jgi:hypothetical protein
MHAGGMSVAKMNMDFGMNVNLTEEEKRGIVKEAEKIYEEFWQGSEKQPCLTLSDDETQKWDENLEATRKSNRNDICGKIYHAMSSNELNKATLLSSNGRLVGLYTLTGTNLEVRLFENDWRIPIKS